MRKVFLLFLVLQFLIVQSNPQKVFAEQFPLNQASVSSGSVIRIDYRTKILQRYLDSYNSPLAQYSNSFIASADAYHLDWRIVAAISGVESYYGHALPLHSYNAWGYNIYGNNIRNFSSFEDGIKTVSKALREDYINKLHSENIHMIGAMYAEDPLWANKVTHFINEINTYQQENQVHVLPLSL